MATIDQVYEKLIEIDKTNTKILENHEVRITRNEKDMNGLGKKVRGWGKIIVSGIIVFGVIISIIAFVK